MSCWVKGSTNLMDNPLPYKVNACEALDLADDLAGGLYPVNTRSKEDTETGIDHIR